jgi:hypothetical protein
MNIKEKELRDKYKVKKNNARRLGHEFSLSFEQFSELFSSGTCFYTGQKLSYSCKTPNVQPTDITIDRVNNHIGYVHGNVVACCHSFNVFKAQFEVSKYAKEHPYYKLMIEGVQRFETKKTDVKIAKIPLKKYSWLSICE